MNSGGDDPDASFLAARLEEDETEDEERDRRDKHDNLDADPSKPGPGEDWHSTFLRAPCGKRDDGMIEECPS